MESKPLSKSKTLWFHLASAGVAASGVGLQYADQIDLSSSEAMGLSMAFVTVQTVGGSYLRTITKTAIK